MKFGELYFNFRFFPYTTFKTFLPKLEKLHATFNNLTKVEHGFHGLPSLCHADLSNNHITFISPDLVAKTRCINHGVLNKLEIVLQGEHKWFIFVLNNFFK